MYMYVCVYIYIYIYIYIYLYTHMCTYIYIYIYTYKSLSLSLYIYIYIHTYIHVYNMDNVARSAQRAEFGERLNCLSLFPPPHYAFRTGCCHFRQVAALRGWLLIMGRGSGYTKPRLTTEQDQLDVSRCVSKMYIYIYIHIHTHTYIHIYIHIHTYTL